MTILVNGKEMELKAIGKNGTEWTQDLLGNYGALHFDDEQDAYTMTEDDFEWWEPVVDMLNEINDLEQELDEDARAEYEAESWPSDLDDEARARLEWLRNHTWRSLSDTFPQQYVVVETDNSADSVDTSLDNDEYMIKMAGKTTLAKLREDAEIIADVIERNGAEECDDESIEIYRGFTRGASVKEECTIYVPSFWA